MEVRRCRLRRKGRFVAGQNLDGDVIALGNDYTVLDELHQSAKAATAVEHLERAARLLDRIDQQVLEDAARLDIGGQLRNFEELFGAGSYVDRRKRKLRKLRSEEHTSELQSLMRISYAVFCLKKKKRQTKV